ncbi:MAG: hypothetical protein JO259_12310 [Mycobacterium sp.]|nr:hypothetical protein [Mycobacterium sp.]
MSELTMATDESRRLADDESPTPQAEMITEPFALPTDAVVRPAPTLITEQEVMLGTAAAQRIGPTRWWTSATRLVAVGLRRVVPSPSAQPRPARRHVPPRASYLEHSRLEREMHRL